VELDAIPDQVQGADLAVCLLDAGGNGQAAGAAAMLRAAMDQLPHPPRTVLVVDDGGGGAHTPEQQPVPMLFCRLLDAAAPDGAPQNILDAFPRVLHVSDSIGARYCGVIASDLRAVTPQWVERLVRPALEMEFDLVAPQYGRHKWQGLINRSILSPLSRALYGKRVQSPMGPDLTLSGKLIAWILADLAGAGTAHPIQPLASIISAAVRGGFQICEARVGARAQPPVDWMNLGSLLAQLLGPVFLDMERNAVTWQRVRGSQAVPAFEGQEAAAEESGTVDVRRLIDSFQLGAKNLQELWSPVLPPTTLLEIRKLSRLPLEQFRMADDLWAGIVYDFALAHRIRTINRDHLLRSLTPLYLGWIASYALEMESADEAAVEERLERLAGAYEAGKPYLMSRWRWPDRFNP
jgi:hypothetical protein